MELLKVCILMNDVNMIQNMMMMFLFLTGVSIPSSILIQCRSFVLVPGIGRVSPALYDARFQNQQEIS